MFSVLPVRSKEVLLPHLEYESAGSFIAYFYATLSSVSCQGMRPATVHLVRLARVEEFVIVVRGS
jgi:hypothetical protein